jgi:hypothetical protein
MARPHATPQLNPLDDHCARHQFEVAVGRCRQCGHVFCSECLVFSFGERQPPFCVPCALAAAGVRSTAGRPPALPRKELKRRQKEESDRLARLQANEAESQANAARIDWSLPVNGSDPNADPVYPSFDAESEPPPPPPPAPAPEPKVKGRPSLLGRRKNKAVPF